VPFHNATNVTNATNSNNANNVNNVIECKLYERICQKKIYLNQYTQKTSFIYNCGGRLYKERKPHINRKTQPPEKLFHYIEFNYNGKLPSYLIINDINQKMQIMANNCCFWTKLVCLDNLINKKIEPNIIDLKNLVSDIYFSQNRYKDGYSKLVKLLSSFLFNENTFGKYIPYRLNMNNIKYSPTYLNFGIGLYKQLFNTSNKPIKINNIYNPVKYNLRKSLLKQISRMKNEKVKTFLDNVIDEFRNFNDATSKDFYYNCLKKYQLIK